MLRAPQKISPLSTTCTSDSTRTRSPQTQAIVEKLRKGQKLTVDSSASKNSNPRLGKTTLIGENIYITHRIRRSPSTSAPKKPTTARKSSESGGESRNRRHVGSLNCWGTNASREETRRHSCGQLSMSLGPWASARSAQAQRLFFLVLYPLLTSIHSFVYFQTDKIYHCLFKKFKFYVC